MSATLKRPVAPKIIGNTEIATAASADDPCENAIQKLNHALTMREQYPNHPAYQASHLQILAQRMRTICAWTREPQKPK